MEASIPWYKSKIIVGVLVSLLFKGLAASGVVSSELDTGMSDELTDTLLLVISAVGDLVAFGSRVNQTRAPSITLTK